MPERDGAAGGPLRRWSAWDLIVVGVISAITVFTIEHFFDLHEVMKGFFIAFALYMAVTLIVWDFGLLKEQPRLVREGLVALLVAVGLLHFSRFYDGELLMGAVLVYGTHLLNPPRLRTGLRRVRAALQADPKRSGPPPHGDTP